MSTSDKAHRSATNKTLKVKAGRFFVHLEPMVCSLPNGYALRLVSDDGSEELRGWRTLSKDAAGRRCVVFEDIEPGARYTLSWVAPSQAELVVFEGAPGSQLLGDTTAPVAAPPFGVPTAPYGRPLERPVYGDKDPRPVSEEP